jgi:thiamine-monophosphate kinase
MRRSGARAGDLIYVTGKLGDASLALHHRLQGESWRCVESVLRMRLERPEPRVEVGLALREIASAAIDISDGLIADLGHILQASGCGAQIRLDRVPVSEPVRVAVESGAGWELPLSAGDDYELCFTLPPAQRQTVARLSESLGLPITRIGRIETTPGLRCVHANGDLWRPPIPGYEHFRSHDPRNGS